MKPHRIEAVDALRGFALVWMAVFHGCFDLSNAGLLSANFYADPFWTWQRSCILSLFLLCAGAGQALAFHQGQSWRRFGVRWLQIAGCAALVSLGSALIFPNSFIYFGVLHGMAVMLVIVRLTASWGRWLWLLGALVWATYFLTPWAFDTGWLSTAWNTKPLNWIGWISVKPITEDYVPLVPWLALIWWGMAATQWWLASPLSQKLALIRLPLVPQLAGLGRWSLSFYMLHQPVLLGALWAWTTLT